MGMAAPGSGGLEGGFDQGGGEAILLGAGLGEVGLEAVDEGHQFIDLGDDAVLFGEGRKWNRHQCNRFGIEMCQCNPNGAR